MKLNVSISLRTTRQKHMYCVPPPSFRAATGKFPYVAVENILDSNNTIWEEGASVETIWEVKCKPYGRSNGNHVYGRSNGNHMGGRSMETMCRVLILDMHDTCHFSTTK